MKARSFGELVHTGTAGFPATDFGGNTLEASAAGGLVPSGAAWKTE
jgi:hypothetical protein